MYMQWLKGEFLDYLDEWEDDASSRDDLTKSEQNRQCLSRETLEGLRMTGGSQLRNGPCTSNLLV